MPRDWPGRSSSVVLFVLASLSLGACENRATPTQPQVNVPSQPAVPDAPAPPPVPPSAPSLPAVAISGAVHEQAPIADVPIAGVSVEVVGSNLAGRSTITDAAGRFSFEGTPPANATLKFTKDGYEDRTHDLVAAQGQAPPETRAVDIALIALHPKARLTIRIDHSGSTNAILGHSPIRFDASASRAVRPTYQLEFGDGGSTTDSVAVHPCARRGILTSRVTVTDAFGRSSVASGQFRCIGILHPQGPVYSLIYGWHNQPDPRLDPGKELARRISFEAHSGSTVSGFYSDPLGNSTYFKRHFTGRLIGDRSILIVLDDGSMEFRGEVLIKDTSGEHFYSVDRTLKLTVKGGLVDGRKLEFEYYDPF